MVPEARQRSRELRNLRGPGWNKENSKVVSDTTLTVAGMNRLLLWLEVQESPALSLSLGVPAVRRGRWGRWERWGRWGRWERRRRRPG